MHKGFELAMAGDVSMLKFFLSRMLPRERPVKIDLPRMEFADDAVEALGAITALRGRYGDAAHYQEGEIYAQLGDVDKAIAALETAWSNRDTGLASMQGDPFLDPVRNNPRFGMIANKVFG